jgi:hypothetical protein
MFNIDTTTFLKMFRVGGAQVVEHLLIKCEAQVQTPVSQNKIK